MEDAYNKLLNGKNQYIMPLKNIYLSLDPNNSVHDKVKNIILTGISNHKYILPSSYYEILNNIYNDNLTDFTIKFTNGKSFQCLKAVIQTIPYFDMAIKEYDISDSIFINDDYDTVVTLIKLQYGINTLTDTNTIDVLLLSDKYLINYIFNPRYFALEPRIIDNMIEEKQYDKLTIIYKISNKYQLSHIIHKIRYSYHGENLFLFPEWQKFELHVIFDAIKKTKKYDLLNNLNHIPKIIVGFLADEDFESNFYPNIFNNQNGFIKSYYPILKYYGYSAIAYSPYVIKLLNNSIKINNAHSDFIINIGTMLTLTSSPDNNITLEHIENNKLTVNKIIKSNGEKSIEIDTLNTNYIPKNIYYEIYFNETINIKIINLTTLWIINYHEYQIKI